MAEQLAPPDVEAAAVTVLADLADSVATRVPNLRPATVIRVTQQGDGERNLILNDVRLLVECWAGDSVAARALAKAAYGTIAGHRDSFMGSVWVGGIEFTGFVNFPDPDTDQPRYQFVAQLTISQEAL